MNEGSTRLTKVVLALSLLVVSGTTGCTKQMRRAYYLSKADKDYAAGRYERAEIEYRKALWIRPHAPNAVARLGLIYYAQGRWVDAAGCLNYAIKLQPTNSEARLKLGLAQTLLGLSRPARAQALTVLSNETGNTEALALLASTMTSTQDVAQAAQAFARVPSAGQNKPGYHVARGTFYLHQGDLAKAEAEYRQELALHPNSSEAYLALGNLFVLRQDLKQAEPLLKKSAELATLYSGARLSYADLRLRTGAAKEGLQDVQELVKKAPDFLPAWLFLARATLAQGKPDESASYLQRVLSQDPANFEALIFGGSLRLAKGDSTKAAAMFQRLIKAYPPGPPQAHYKLALAQVMENDLAQARENLNRALAMETNYVDAILLLAKLDLRQGNTQAAIRALSRLVQQQPQLAQPYQDLSVAYLREKKYDEAARTYRRMMQVFTNNAEVPFNLGSVLIADGQTNEARQAFEMALIRAPDFVPAHEKLVALDLAQGRADQAIQRVDQLIQKYPKAAVIQVLLATIHIHEADAIVAREKQKQGGGAQLRLGDVPAARGEVSQAETALLKAIELSPDNRAAYQMLASLYVNSNRQRQALERLDAVLTRTNDLAVLLEKGVIQEGMKDYSAARDTYQKALKLQPNAVDVLNNLAYLYIEHLGDLQRAYELAEKANQLQPASPAIADTLGWVLYRRGQYARALGLIEEAASKLSGNPEVQCHLGLAHYMLGEEQPARMALQRGLQGSQESSASKEAAEALDVLNTDPAAASPTDRARLEARLRQSPDDPVALQRLAAIQEREGQPKAAIETYERALNYIPTSARVAFKLATLHSQAGNQSKALEMAKAAHTLVPGDAQISALLGRLAYQTANYGWAASLLQESAATLPNNADILYDLAWAQYSLGRVPEAVAAMQNALKAPGGLPQSEDAKRFLALVAAAASPAQAEPQATEAEKRVAADPKYVPGLMVCALRDEGRGDFNHAAQLYERVLTRYPSFTPAMRNLALLCFAHLQNDWRAYELASKAQGTFPADVPLTRTLGILCYRRGDYARCAETLKSLPPAADNNGELLCYLGLAQYRLKDNIRSKSTLQQALTLNPPTKLAEEAKQVLASLR